MKAPRIETLQPKTMVGLAAEMSVTQNSTAPLWRSFMEQRHNIQNVIGKDVYSLQEYPSVDYFSTFNPNTIFTKWALAEVNNTQHIPEGFQPYTLQGGTYAVFHHKGNNGQDFTSLLMFIFNTWLPSSDYVLDHRPHFEVLGAKYKNNDPNSEEEVWIPITKKES